MIAAILRRPIGMVAVYVTLAGLAGLACLRLPVALLPSLQFPSLVIWTAYPEGSPQRVEETVTQRIEDEIAGISGLRRLSSRSLLGGSMVRLDLGWSSDLDLASFSAQQKLDRLSSSFPEGVERPVVLRVDPSDRPVMVLAVSPRERLGDGRVAEVDDLIAIKQLARDVVARRLEQLDGIARVRTTGGYEPEIEILLDRDRIAAYQLDLEQITQALENANFSSSGGKIRRGAFEYTVEVLGGLESVGEIERTVVSDPERPPVYLHEVATVRESVRKRRGMVRLDNREVLLLLVERRPDSNTVETAAEVRDVLASLRQELAGVDLNVVVDESRFIETAFRGTVEVAIWGGLLAIASLLIFLRDRRTVFAVACAVPFSVMITVVLFDALGLTFNLISLGGLALGMGMLVDNAVVVVDNIARERQQGLQPLEAARRGTSEVTMAIFASTATTIAVFLPLTFVDGLAGRLFRDQSLAVVCSLGASLFVALTAVPLIVSRHRGSSAAAPTTPWWVTAYEWALDGCLRHPRWVLASTLVFLLLAGWLGWHLPREAVPADNVGRLEVEITLPAEAGLSRLAERSADLERTLSDIPGVRHVLADLGERDMARLELDPRSPHAGELTVILEQGVDPLTVQKRFLDVSWPSDVAVGITPVRSELETLLIADGSDLTLDIRSDGPTRSVQQLEPLMETLRNRPELTNVALAHAGDIPAFALHFRRDRLLRYGKNAEAIGSYVEAAVRGREAITLQTGGREVPVVLRTDHTSSIDGLLAEWVSSSAGLLPLGTFFRVESVRVPAVLLRASRAPVLRIGADVAPGADLSTAIGGIEQALVENLPAEVHARISSSQETFLEGAEAAAWSLLLSILLVYLILAAQLESLLQPLAVLATVPPAIAGVVLGLAVTGQTWNLISLTGTVVLVGIAVNAAIVLVDFIGRRHRAGLALEQAIREAGKMRLRAILITASTTVLGMLPLALGLGEGGPLRQPLAVAVIGGLVVSTLSALLVVPLVYRMNVLLAKRARRHFGGFFLDTDSSRSTGPWQEIP